MVALWLPLLIVACGAGSDGVPYAGPRAPDSFDACALFPASEAKAELPDREIGQLSGPLDASSGTKFARCAYGHGPAAVLDAALDVRRYESPAVLRRTLEGALPMLRRLSAGDLTAVFGVGDFAWWAGGGLRILAEVWIGLEQGVQALADREAVLGQPDGRLEEARPGQLAVLGAPGQVTFGAAVAPPAAEP